MTSESTLIFMMFVVNCETFKSTASMFEASNICGTINDQNLWQNKSLSSKYKNRNRAQYSAINSSSIFNT